MSIAQERKEEATEGKTQLREQGRLWEGEGGGRKKEIDVKKERLRKNLSSVIIYAPSCHSKPLCLLLLVALLC